MNLESQNLQGIDTKNNILYLYYMTRKIKTTKNLTDS